MPSGFLLPAARNPVVVGDAHSELPKALCEPYPISRSVPLPQRTAEVLDGAAAANPPNRCNFIGTLKVLGENKYTSQSFAKLPFRNSPFTGDPIIPDSNRDSHFATSRQSLEIATVGAENGDEVLEYSPNRNLNETDQTLWHLPTSSQESYSFGLHGEFFAPTHRGADVTRLFTRDKVSESIEINGSRFITATLRHIFKSHLVGPPLCVANSTLAKSVINPD